MLYADHWDMMQVNVYNKMYLCCYHLGPLLAAPRSFSAQFGDGNRPFAYAISRCFGWEKSISECVRQVHGSCSRSQAAGVTCRDGNNNLYC